MDKILEFSHHLLEKKLTKDDLSIDMTAGNGNDTLFLAGLSRHVYAFDVQSEAIKACKEKTKGFNNITFLLDSHENVKKYVKEEVSGVIFNLGYLPNGDKSITTKSSSTKFAIKEVLSILKCGGICVICLYPGHPEGKKESIEVVEMVKELDQHEFDVLKYEFINQIHEPPFLIAIEKKI